MEQDPGDAGEGGLIVSGKKKQVASVPGESLVKNRGLAWQEVFALQANVPGGEEACWRLNVGAERNPFPKILL